MTTYTKRERVHIFNRRTVAYLLELLIVHVTATPLLAVLLLITTGKNHDLVVNLGVWLPYLVFRDALGIANWAKRAVGLELVSTTDEPLTLKRKVVRNLMHLVPFGVIAEFYKALHGDEQMRRYGDLWAGTAVRLRDGVALEGSFNLPLVGLLAAHVAATVVVSTLTSTVYVAVTGEAPAHQAAANTSKYIDHDLGFSVALPAGMTLEPPPNNVAAEAKGMLFAGMANLDGAIVVVGVGEYDTAALADVSVDDFVAASTFYQRTGDRAHLELVGTGERGDNLARERRFYRGNRYYSMIVLYAKAEPMPPRAKRALSSFALTGTAPKDSALAYFKQPTAQAAAND